LSADTEIKFH